MDKQQLIDFMNGPALEEGPPLEGEDKTSEIVAKVYANAEMLREYSQANNHSLGTGMPE